MELWAGPRRSSPPRETLVVAAAAVAVAECGLEYLLGIYQLDQNKAKQKQIGSQLETSRESGWMRGVVGGLQNTGRNSFDFEPGKPLEN